MLSEKYHWKCSKEVANLPTKRMGKIFNYGNFDRWYEGEEIDVEGLFNSFRKFRIMAGDIRMCDMTGLRNFVNIWKSEIWMHGEIKAINIMR